MGLFYEMWQSNSKFILDEYISNNYKENYKNKKMKRN